MEGGSENASQRVTENDGDSGDVEQLSDDS